MRPTFKSTVKIAMTSVVGVALCAALGTGSANAQDKMKSKTMTDKSMQKQDRMMMEHDGMSDGRMMDDYDRYNLLPIAPSYPEAIPGGLDMYYWNDFRKRHTGPGSAAEETWIRTYRRTNIRLSKTPMDAEEDRDDVMPVAMSYPEAIPGGLDMYYWNGIRKRHAAIGSPAEEAWIRMYRRTNRRLSKDKMVDDDEVRIPVIGSYPAEAPGTLDTSYWSDFTRTHHRWGMANEDRNMMKMKSGGMKRSMP